MNPTSRRLITFVGRVKLADIQNATHRGGVEAFCETQEQLDPNIKQAEIKGSTPHKSHNDESDPKPVISVKLLDAQGRRIGTAHVHEDGTGSVRRAN